MSTVGDGRRRWPRAPVAVWTRIRCRGDDVGRWMVSHDLTPEGALFSTIRPVREGDLVILQIELPTGTCPLVCKARACWSRPMPNGLHGFGVRFLDLDDDARDRLQTFLDQSMQDCARGPSNPDFAHGQNAPCKTALDISFCEPMPENVALQCVRERNAG